MDGHIKLHRKFMDWEWYKNINTKELFIHMLLKANWKDGKYEGKVVPRGSFISSLRSLSMETGLTEREIRTSISRLKSTGEVTSQSTSKYTVFTVVNYFSYQTDDRQNGKQPTDERHTNDILTTTIEEREERKKERTKDICVDSSEPGVSKVESAVIKKNNTEYPYKDVIDYLNQIANTAFKEKSKDSRKHIKARIDEGFSLDDFKRVIDNKVSEWGNDSEMAAYIRPSTLFGLKFEGYLNQKKVKTMIHKKNGFDNFDQRETDYDAMVLTDIQKRG